MKLISYSLEGGLVRPGAVLDEAELVVDLYDAGYRDTLSAITAGVSTLDGLHGCRRHKLSAVRLHPPIANPPRIFAIGLNYRDHAIESKMPVPTVPVVFFKLQHAIIGSGDTIVLPKISSEPDYEAEFAFVIGKGGYRIAATAWREHVYGYTIVNDISARDIQMSSSQWSLAKSFPSFCPIGPAIVTADEVPDSHELDISLTIDGEVLQKSNTRELIFRIPALIEYISSITPLLPGDIVSTGTPPGVGMGRSPKMWLRAGESMIVTIEKLGSLQNRIEAEPTTGSVL
jgi:2-keto-4-pentenoate hydratase/2-oxohepta-3-ene-1,7-dioic acid hydratase in catechol pathway